jgi:hypothetical protein
VCKRYTQSTSPSTTPVTNVRTLRGGRVKSINFGVNQDPGERSSLVLNDCFNALKYLQYLREGGFGTSFVYTFYKGTLVER